LAGVIAERRVGAIMLDQLGTTHGRPPRVDVRVPVDILCGKGIRLSGKTRNVSEGGMFVETALLLPVGSPVRCDLALEDSSIEVFGRIAWSRPRQHFAAAGMGIQFVGFENGARRVLHHVVESGEPVPRMVPFEVTARVRRRRPGAMVQAAVFAGVSLATAGVVMAILPSGAAGVASGPAAAATPVAATTAARSPIASMEIVAEEEEADRAARTAAEGNATGADADAAGDGEVAIVPRADGTTAVTLPIEGNIALRHFRLAEPDGVALFFDSGYTTAELKTYRRPDGVVHQVWIGARGHEVRLFTRGAPPPYRVDTFEHSVRVLFEPAATAVSR